MAALEYPNRIEEYIHSRDGFTSWNWEFGLPDPDSDTGRSCGALPFREGAGLGGVNAPRVLRGEDWTFMRNWAWDRRALVDGSIWTDWTSCPVPEESRGPRLQQKVDMYSALSALHGVYGSDFQFADKTYAEYDSGVFRSDLKAGLAPCAPLASREPDRILSLSAMDRFFADMAKLKCTFVECQPQMAGGGSYGTLYDFWQRDGEPATIQSHNLSSIWLRIDSTYRDKVPDPDRVVAFDVQFLALYTCSQHSSDAQPATKYVLAKLQGRQTMTQRIGQQHMFYRALTWGGNTAANAIAGIAGMNTRPTAPQYGYAGFTLQLDATYAVAWPKYLQL